MTQIGEGCTTTSINTEDVDSLYFLRFRLIDEIYQPIANIAYKTVKAGLSAEPLHIADGKTTLDGTTNIVSVTKNEEIDFYIVWAKLTVNKGFLKI